MICLLYFLFAFACIHAGRSGRFTQNPLIIAFQNSVITHGDLSPFLANKDLMREIDDLDLAGAYRYVWESHYTDHLKALEKDPQVITRILFKLAHTFNSIEDPQLGPMMIHILSLPSSTHLSNDRKMVRSLFFQGARHEHFDLVRTLLDREDLRRCLDDNTIEVALDLASHRRNTRLVELLTTHPNSAQISILHVIKIRNHSKYSEPIKSLLNPIHILEKLPRDQVDQIFDYLSERGYNALKVYVHFPDSFTLDRTYKFILNALLQRSKDVGAILADDDLIRRFPEQSATDLVLLLAHFHENGILISFLEKYYQDRNVNKVIYAAAVDAALEAKNWPIVRKYAPLRGVLEKIPIDEWNSIMTYAALKSDVAVFDRLVDATLAHPLKKDMFPVYATMLMDGSKNELLLARLLKNPEALDLISDDLITYALNSLAASGRVGSIVQILKSPDMEKRDFSRFIYSIIHSGITNHQPVLVSFFTRPRSEYLLELSSQSLTDLLELAIRSDDTQIIVMMLKNEIFVKRMPHVRPVLDGLKKDKMMAQLAKGVAAIHF